MKQSAFRASVLPALSLLCASPWLAVSPSRAAVPSPLESANPLVGTAEHGHTYPGAAVPFGLVQLSPDTPLQGWDGSSGYHYSDSVIRGFSHTHLEGTGVGGLGDILLMPTVGEVQLNAGNPLRAEAGYASLFSHAQEVASPGYYRVFLQGPQVLAEMTATARVGLHRYTFPTSEQAHIILDLEHGVGNSAVQTTLQIENSTTISGSRSSNGWGGRRDVYFVAQFSRPFSSPIIEQDGQRLDAGAGSATGKSVKAAFNFQTRAEEPILVKVGISGTGVEGARRNLQAEIPVRTRVITGINLSLSDVMASDFNFDFDAVRNAAARQWSEALGSVQIETAEPQVRRTFYSNLYLSMLSPTLFNDADKTYRGLDKPKQNHSGANFDNYTTFSLWDIFRAEQPLITLLQPSRVPSIVQSLLEEYTERNRQEMPVWPLWGNETGTMIGYHSAPVVADAYLKGFRGFDAEGVYQALKTTAMNGRNGQDEYQKYGYVLSSGAGSKQSVSRTLEFAYDDWCIAQLAQALGHKEDAAMFLGRAGNYRNLFDTTTGFMRGRKADGSWRRPFNPKQLVWADYTEANAWQYTWSVMQDAPGLVRIMGGDAPFVAKLDALFNEKSDVIANIPDITGLIGQYAHGNEPVHHVAYLYNYAGAPWKTQQRVRQIMDTLYNDTPAGQPGNNDCGQMSAWYVFSALGFYPTNPVGGVYTIGSPRVSRATLQLDRAHYGGRTFSVLAPNNSARNMYIQSATLNGRPLSRSWITQSEIAQGGQLRLVMGPNPNINWGRALADRPPSGLPASFRYAALPTPSMNKPVVLGLPIRVAAGSDTSVSNFVPYPNEVDGSTNGSTSAIDVSALGAAPAGVYQSEMYGSDYSLSFPVPKNARYNVRLHFAEIFGAKIGERIENVDINGQRVLSNLDIAREAGYNKALVKDFPNIAPDARGNIVVRVTAAPGSADQNAKISGLEITAQ